MSVELENFFEVVVTFREGRFVFWGRFWIKGEGDGSRFIGYWLYIGVKWEELFFFK